MLRVLLAVALVLTLMLTPHAAEPQKASKVYRSGTKFELVVI